MQDFDRSSIIGFVLLGVLMIVYLNWQSRTNQALVEAEQARMDSIADVQSRLRQDSLLRVNERANEAFITGEGAPVPATTDSTVINQQQQRRATRLGLFAPLVEGQETAYTIEDDHLRISFSNRGGRITQVGLKKYTDYLDRPLELFSEGELTYHYSFFYEGNRRINTDSLFAQALPDADGKGIRFRFQTGPEQWFDQVYRLSDTAHVLDYKLDFSNYQEVISPAQPYLELTWNADLKRQEVNQKYERQMTKAYFRYADGETGYKSRNGSEPLESRLSWMSYVDQFFNATLIASNGFERGGEVSVKAFEDEDTLRTKAMRSRLFLQVPQQAQSSVDLQFVFAPNHYNGLKKLDQDLERVVPVGTSIIGWCNKFVIIPIFNLLNRNIANYGIIILILTLLIKVAFTPLTYRSYVSMVKMRLLKPEMDAIKEKYGEDQQRMSQETMKLYQTSGVSPLGGCLPQLLQMPILFAMYRFFPNSIELRHEPFLWATDLSSYDSILALPFTIPFYGAHVSLFTLLAAITSIAYARMNSQMTGAMGGQMVVMQYLFPVMMLFIFNSFSSALTYYYLLTNIITFGQQWLIKTFFVNEDALHAQIQENKAKPRKKGGWQERLEAYTKAQQSKVKAAKPAKKK
ncbi:MAG: membrane protein insertase YidC [Bacteroidetes bacterium]|nr:membrane protein insertase YidC [Bacteroidota bacterium]